MMKVGMTRGWFRIAVLIVAIFAATSQCVISCTTDSHVAKTAQSDVPPCHQQAPQPQDEAHSECGGAPVIAELPHGVDLFYLEFGGEVTPAIEISLAAEVQFAAKAATPVLLPPLAKSTILRI